jgi:hypothetical protein
MFSSIRSDVLKRLHLTAIWTFSPIITVMSGSLHLSFWTPYPVLPINPLDIKHVIGYIPSSWKLPG